MCGIFGYDLSALGSSVSDSQRATLTTALSVLNDTRGGHSWGFVGISRSRGQIVRRGLGDITEVVSTLLPYRRLMAHTRFGTHGSATIANAHPFQIGRILGAHNGVISNHSELNSKYKRSYSVDSQHIFAHMDAGLSLTDIHGYGAIEWLENGVAGIHLAKLAGGSLSVAKIAAASSTKASEENEAPCGTVWSSDDAHLRTALNAAGLLERCTFYQIDVGKTYSIQSGVCYQLTTRAPLELGESYPRLVTAGGVLSSWRGGGNDSYYTSGSYSRSKKTKRSHKPVTTSAFGTIVDDFDDSVDSDDDYIACDEQAIHEMEDRQDDIDTEITYWKSQMETYDVDSVADAPLIQSARECLDDLYHEKASLYADYNTITKRGSASEASAASTSLDDAWELNFDN